MASEVWKKEEVTSDNVPEVYDVILNVSSHGIHNPLSLHAFKSQRIYLIPTKCYVCSKIILPYSDTAKCIRCCVYVHRSCCNSRNSTLICQGWNPSNSEMSSKSEPESVCFSAPVSATPLPMAAPPKLVTLLEIPECYESLLPQPGSTGCLWKRCIQQISKDFYLTRMTNITNTPNEIEKITNRLLSDATTFPGRVFKELRAVYMYLKFNEDSEYLVHAREALDNIACSVVSILPIEIGDDMDSLKMVVTVVDWRVLRQDEGSMYDKVFGAAKRIGNRMDNILLARLYQQQEAEQQELEDMRKKRQQLTPRQLEELPDLEWGVNTMEKVLDTPRYEEIHVKLGKIPGEFAVMDKLERLVEALKLIAAAQPAEKAKCDDNTSDNNEAKAAFSNRDSSEMTLEETMQNYDIDADSLMKKFCDILGYETLKYEFYWNAESIYVDYMCREYNWLLGAEGYALVTLQQALRALCPNAATLSAVQAGVNIEKHKMHNKPALSLYSSSKESHEDETRSFYSSKDEEDRSTERAAFDINNSELLISASSKMKGGHFSPVRSSFPVMGSE